MTELLTTVQSIMSFQRQSSQEDGSQRKKSSLWYRRSLRGGSSGLRQDTKSLPRPSKPKQACKQLVDYSNPQRTTVTLEKQDNETFGFELQTYGVQLRHSAAVEMCTFVLTVEEESAAESAGLAAGDVIVSINGTSIEGSSHQHVLDLIRESANTVKLETVYGSVMKWIELEKRLNVLKQSLSQKLLELHSLNSRESQLTRGNMNMMVDFPDTDDKSRLTRRSSSCSSYRSTMTDDSDLNSVFEDLSSPFSAASASDDGCFFSRDFPLPSSFSQQHPHRSLSRSSSSSVASSTSSSSPTADEVRISSLFGTLPRKGRRTSMRKNILKFLPGLQRSVEEE
ncbi:cytohesin-interacting protein [Synchiropus splendidus]|uniref:cytohesin-interacting protein n=1 Tax=Synchiropus splendidus TaxID=270530 RepID=UPI00237ED212|nr:cytohesin-interacting protein [Synchiropus splendidus]